MFLVKAHQVCSSSFFIHLYSKYEIRKRFIRNKKQIEKWFFERLRALFFIDVRLSIPHSLYIVNLFKHNDQYQPIIQNGYCDLKENKLECVYTVIWCSG